MSRVEVATDLRASPVPAQPATAVPDPSGVTAERAGPRTGVAAAAEPVVESDAATADCRWDSVPAGAARRGLVRAIHAIALIAFASLAALAGCASPPADDESSEPAAAMRPDVAVAEFARGLGLRVTTTPDGRSTLEAPDGGRILLFSGTTIASVAGQRVDLTRAVAEAGSDLWLSADDADTLRATWRTQVALGATRPVPAGTGTRVPIPTTSRPSAGTAPTPPVKKPAGFDDNRPTASEAAAWGVPLKRKWLYIVVHHSASAAGSAAMIDGWHKDRGMDGLGYDFVIGNGNGSADGLVEVGFRWKQQREGAHAKTAGNFMNEHGIGICLVGDFTRTKPTAAQMRALDRLCTFLAQHCSIPAANLRMHGEVKATECPGKFFPRDFAIRLPTSSSKTASTGTVRGTGTN